MRLAHLALRIAPEHAGDLEHALIALEHARVRRRDAFARTLRDQVALPQAKWTDTGAPAIIEAMDCAKKLRSYAGLNLGKGADWQTNWRSTIALAPSEEAPEKLMEAACAQKNLASRPAGG